MPIDNTEILIAAERIHDAVYHVVVSNALGQPVDSEASLGWEIYNSLPKLLLHEMAYK